MDKINRDGEKKKTLRLYRCCSSYALDNGLINSSWIMDLRIYGEGKTKIPPGSPAAIGPLPKIQDRQRLY